MDASAPSGNPTAKGPQQYAEGLSSYLAEILRDPSGLQLNIDVLHLGVLVQALEAIRAPDARLFGAAHLAGRVQLAEGIDPDHAGTYLLRDAQSLVDVARPNGGGQPVHRRVGHPRGI